MKPQAAALLALLSLPQPLRAEVPADGWVVWASNRVNGRTEIYRARADGSEVKRLTDAGGTFPSWSPDGRWIEYNDEAGDAFLMRPDGSERKKLPVRTPEGAPAFWLHDNSGLVMTEPNGAVNLYDPDTLEKTPLFKLGDFPNKGPLFHLYSMTHDNRYLFVASDIFTDGFTVTNGTYKTGYSAILIDLLNKKKMYMVGGGCWPFTPPEGDLVYHIRGDNPTWPDIYRMNLADLDTRRSYEAEVAHPDADWGHEYHPRISNDNKWLVYMTSNGCHWDYSCNNEIFIHRLGAGPSERTRVTDHESFDGFPGLHVGPLWQKSSEPRLVAAPRRLTFFARAGAAPPSQTIRIKNDGGGALGAARATVEPPAKWLEVQTSKAGLTVSLRGANLRRGRHTAMVALAVEGAGDSATMIPVTVHADDSFPPDSDGGAGADADAPPVSPKEARSGGCSVARAAGAGPVNTELLWVALALVGLCGLQSWRVSHRNSGISRSKT